MEQIIGQVISQLDDYLLIFLRMTALIVSSPIFGRGNIPAQLKIGFCLILAYIMLTVHPLAQPIHYLGLLDYTMLCAKEMLFGLALGYVTTLFFSITHTAGFLMDMQMGFSMASVFDPHTNTNMPLAGSLLNSILIVTFFGVNGHHLLIRILGATMDQIPIGHVTFNPNIAWVAVEVFTLSFILSINVAMPIMAAGMLGEVAMGVISRTVPQINVFVLGIPLKSFVGLFALLLIVPMYVSFSDVLFQHMFTSIEKILSGLVSIT